MASQITGAVLGSVQETVGALQSLLRSPTKSVERQLRKLGRVLEKLEEVVRDAMERAANDAAFDTLLKQIREAVYHAEDFLADVQFQVPESLLNEDVKKGKGFVQFEGDSRLLVSKLGEVAGETSSKMQWEETRDSLKPLDRWLEGEEEEEEEKEEEEEEEGEEEEEEKEEEENLDEEIVDFLENYLLHIPNEEVEGIRKMKWQEVRYSLSSPLLLDRDSKHRLAKWVQYFLERINDISRRFSSLDFGRPTGSDFAEFLVFGRNCSRENLVKSLLSEDKQSVDGISVIPIVGERGVGKTTVARMIYRDAMVQKHFGVRIWISVAERFEPEKLWRAIIRSVTGRSMAGRCPEEVEKALHALLRARLRTENLLLVLDDVWIDEESQWMEFTSPLAATGTVKIIVAAWKEDVVQIVQTLPACRLTCLSEDESWSLFERCAFGDQDPDEHPSLVKIGKEINRKCKGMPLAVRAIGSALCYESNESKWMDVCESETWRSDQYPALLLSYDCLPDYLRRCLAYCSLFPKGYNFDKRQLTRLWMAQGFILTEGSERMEDTASDYFEELVRRSFIQLSQSPVEILNRMTHSIDIDGDDDDGDDDDGANDSQQIAYDVEDNRLYVMHNLIKDLLPFASNFSMEFQHLYQHELVLQGRHSSLRTYIYVDDAEQNSVSSSSQNMVILCDILLQSESLQALELRSSNIRSLPYPIGNLKNLQYLCLKCNITSLPASVCELYNLQTLDLSDCALLNMLPHDIKNLTMLRHLDLPLRKTLYYPNNTRVLISDVFLPRGIHKLTCLQYLSGIHVGRDQCGIAALEQLLLLRRRLIISGLNNLNSAEESRKGNLKTKMNLQELILEGNEVDPSISSHESKWMGESGRLHHWEDVPIMVTNSHAIRLTPAGFEESILESLQPHTNLKMLVISSYAGSTFPNWVGDPSFSQLTSVILDGREQNSSRFLPPLGQLPSLRSLFIARMYGIQSVGDEFCSISNNSSIPAFPSLLDLTFEDMPQWRVWNYVQDGDFPCLHKLTINCCLNLSRLPLLPSLTSMYLSYLSQIVVILTGAKLASLEILRCKNLRSVTLHHNLHSLQVLKISNCLGLTLLTGLSNQVALERLAIHSCPKLRFSPVEPLPLVPRYVDVRESPWLTRWCLGTVNHQKGVPEKSKGTVELGLSSSLLDELVVYGREDENRKLVEMLLSDYCRKRHVSVIYIVAASGVGKTALVHLIYNDSRVCQAFESRVWVSANKEVGVERVLKALVESLTGMSCLLTELSELQEIVKVELVGRKFLLVLEDIWNEDGGFLNSLLVPLMVGAMGSIVLVTTQGKMTSSMMGLMSSYELKKLSNADCWSVFKQKALHGRDRISDVNLLELGKQIASKCEGVPLVAKVLGGLLGSAGNYFLWEHVLQSKLWEQDNLHSQTFPILRLSYDYLPEHLRRCFSFCSLFPKGYMFEKDHIVRLWMSQGFIQAEEGNKVEDIGNRFFDELFNWSLFECAQPCDGNIEKFVIHDLMFDLAQSALGDEFLRVENNELFSICTKVRHISVVRYDMMVQLQLEPFKQSIDLHTLMLIRLNLDESLYYIENTDVLNDLFMIHRNLKTLDLSYTNIKELPESVGHLKCLCYLAINGTMIRRLPDSLCSLYKLQTLELRDCGLLRQLPTDIKNLVNLRNLDVSRELGFVYMPKGFGRLTSIRTLPTFYVGGGELCCDIREMRKMVNIRGKLQIAGLENVIGAKDAMQAKLENKVYIQNLTLQWSDGEIDFRSDDSVKTAGEVLQSLQPNTDLEKLTIRDYFGSRFPTWISHPSFSNLISITLDNCYECDSLPTLGELPSLKYLSIRKINNVQIVGREFCGSDTVILNKFPSLEILRIWEMNMWEEWFGVRVKDFPCLRCLSINRCLKLKNLPSFTFLLELSILYCTEMLDIPYSPHLKKLKIEGIKNLEYLNLPPTLPVLEELDINHCNQLLSVVGLKNLPSIEQLKVSKCPKVYFSPREQLPKTLHVVNIHRSCSSLSQWYPYGFDEEANQGDYLDSLSRALTYTPESR